MTVKKAETISKEVLRLRAEELLREIGTAGHPKREIEPLKLHHELQVHQVELEMQNIELRHSRNELEESLEKYTDLYDFSPVGYVSLDCKGTILSVNLTGSSLIGIVRSRLVGSYFGQFVTEETLPAFTTFLEKLLTSPVKAACEMSFRKEGNAPLCVQVEGVALASKQECHIALIDITERKQAEKAFQLLKETAEIFRLEKEAAETLRLKNKATEALRLEKEIAEVTAQAKNQFFVNMNHELRTPMTGILGMLQLALAEDMSPVLRKYLEISQSSARSLLRILNDILDMAKIEAGKLIIEKIPFSLQRCISDSVDINTPEALRKGLDFVISVSEEIPNIVLGDQIRLQQVLINLVGNAIKFTEGGMVKVQITSVGTNSEGKQEVTFAVTDTGIGIPNNKKELLFRTFSQVDSSHSRSFGGTGLGLAISKEIVELMGGTISFVSEAGVGSSFTFTIPLVEGVIEIDTLPAAEFISTETIPTVMNGARVSRFLLCEDDPVIREVLGGMLNNMNYHLDFAEDGQIAIEMWENGVYDLVLMDVQMPRVNGFEATRVIREKESKHGGHTPIIAMTAHARKEDEENCLAAGMDAFISKPIDFMKSLQVIENIIRQAAAPCTASNKHCQNENLIISE